MDYAIRMNEIKMSYGKTEVLKGVNLSVKKGEVLAIIGASGSGKSTLLRMIIGLAKPTSGEIFINELEVENFDEKSWNELRKNMGMVFQYSALFDSMTVGENVAFGLRQHTKKSNEEITAIVDNMLDMVGLSGYNEYMPGELSGGMKKRVSLARALAIEPDILLYDEPTAGLDPVMSEVINNLMMEAKKNLSITSVLVTHDMYSAFMVADRIAMIDAGVIIEEGTPKDILNSVHPVVRQFIHTALPTGGLFDEK